MKKAFRAFCLKVTLLLLCVCLIASCDRLHENTSESTTVQGNTNGNIHANGTAITDSEWIYYSNMAENNLLYKKRLDGSDKKQLSSDHFAYELNILNNTIYYNSGRFVYRIDTEGRGDTIIIDQPVQSLMLYGDHLFYILAYDDDWGKLYRTDLDGKGKVLLNESVCCFAIDCNTLYYSNMQDSYAVYSMDLNGDNSSKIADVYSRDIEVNNDHIYYTDCHDSEKLYRVKKNGDKRELLSSEQCWGINLSGDYIYYRNQSQRGTIYRIKIDGSTNELLIDYENSGSINIVRDIMLFHSVGGNYKADLNGNNIHEWE